jgi:hypothetical protein
MDPNGPLNRQLCGPEIKAAEVAEGSFGSRHTESFKLGISHAECFPKIAASISPQFRRSHGDNQDIGEEGICGQDSSP